MTIDSKNQHFKNNEKLIIGKSDIFDVFEFASRDAKMVLIPSKIVKISPYSFQFSSIEKVVISPSVAVIGEFSFSDCFILTDSQLEVIQKNGFQVFPVRKICKLVFDSCLLLGKIEFAQLDTALLVGL